MKKTSGNDGLIAHLVFPLTNGQVISNAWRLYVITFKEYYLYWLPSIVLGAILPEVYNLIHSILYPDSNIDIWSSLGVKMAILPLIIFVYVSFCILFTKSFYNLLVGKDSSMKNVFNVLKPRKFKLFFLSIVITINILIMIIVLVLLLLSPCSLILLLLLGVFSRITLMLPVLSTVLVIIEDIPLSKCSKKVTEFLNKNKSQSNYFGLILVGLTLSLISMSYTLYYSLFYLITEFNITIIETIYVFFFSIILKSFIIVTIGPLALASSILYYINNKATLEGYDLELMLKTNKII